MVNVALFVRLEAKPGKEAEVAEFLRADSRLSRRKRRRLPRSAFGLVFILNPNSKVRDILEPRFQGRKLADPDVNLQRLRGLLKPAPPSAQLFRRFETDKVLIETAPPDRENPRSRATAAADFRKNWQP